MGALSTFFGYILNFIYNLVSNYGVAIILFSILLKIILLPLSIKQQKTLIKTSKIQDKIKNIQKKYTTKEGERPSPEEQTKMNQELMALYKQEGISPFSGCLPTIIQLVLLIAIFGVVRNPLTHIKKVDQNTINAVSKYIVEENQDYKLNKSYPQISILKYVSENQDKVIYVNNQKQENIEETENSESTEKIENTEEIEIIENADAQESINEDTEKVEQEEKQEINLNDLYINMNFLGLDLNKIPRDNLSDYTVYIIPILYVLTSVLSMKLTTMKSKKNKDEIIEVEKVEDEENKEIEKENKKEELNMSDQMSKNMSWFMPIMAVSIAIIAPLGLALYWLMNNVLMIIERLVIGKILDIKKEAK